MIQWILDLFSDRTFGAARSSRWSSVRKAHLALHPKCAVCGKKGTLLSPSEVHHVESFASKPELELLESNLLTGCREHHLWFYHLGSWQSLNKDVREDVKIWSEKIKNRPMWNGKEWIYPE